MFKVKSVDDCPYSRKSQGVVMMTPELIAQIAAAVHDPDEWAIVLQGERKERGYLIEVTGYRLPEQRRSSGHVDVAPMDLEENDVGVIHSHHKLGAFFSTTDEKELNPRFPMSIVVAQKKLQYLGFDYLGTGRVSLPCGAKTEIPFAIQPTVGPVVATVKEVAHRAEDLGDCVNYEDKPSDEYHVHYVAACGLEEPETLKANAFGQEAKLLDEVKLLPRPQLTQAQWDQSGSKSLVVTSLDCYKCNKNYPVKGTFGDYWIWCDVCKVKSIPVGQKQKESATLADLAKETVKRFPTQINCSNCQMLIAARMGLECSYVWCSKCLVRTESQGETPSMDLVPDGQGGWLSALIPDRFKRVKEPKPKVEDQRGDKWCRVCINDLEFCECSEDQREVVDEDAEDVFKCDACGEYDPFESWECGNCGDGVYCSTCNVGHNATERRECV